MISKVISIFSGTMPAAANWTSSRSPLATLRSGEVTSFTWSTDGVKMPTALVDYAMRRLGYKHYEFVGRTGWADPIRFKCSYRTAIRRMTLYLITQRLKT